MAHSAFTRREFLKTSGAFSAAAVTLPGLLRGAEAARRTATDQVMLGSTGLTLSRLGMGTGSNNGYVQAALGRAGFTSLVHYAYEQGITYFDCAPSYATFTWIADAIQGLPREKLFVLSKVEDRPRDVLKLIDRQRKTLKTDYIDALLIHCMTRELWTDEWKYMMDAFNIAKEKKWIRSKGVSCHTLEALQASVESPWPEVHLVRVNPQGSHTDAPLQEQSGGPGPVLAELRKMHAMKRGVIGMKIIGNGDFRKAEDRERSIRFVMSLAEVDAITIGFKNRAEIDEAIERINRALASA
jgi:predicted aldo/keto reductase-like oxidoreductase